MIEFFSITPEIDGWMFLFFTVLACFTAAFGVVAGLGGGVLLIGFMATVFPPVALIPVHGVVQAGSNVTRTIIAHRLVMKQAIIPFAIGAILGSAIGGKIVISIPLSLLQMILGIFMLYVCFSPKITAGMPTKKRFFALGMVGAFISMFIGANVCGHAGPNTRQFLRGSTSSGFARYTVEIFKDSASSHWKVVLVLFPQCTCSKPLCCFATRLSVIPTFFQTFSQNFLQSL